MDNLQKTVTLSTCTIYNWHQTNPQPILVLTLANPTKPLLYRKTYRPAPHPSQLTLPLHLKITYPPEEKQLLLTLEPQTHSHQQTATAQLTLNLDQLADRQCQYFTTTLQDCIVRLSTQPHVSQEQSSNRGPYSSKIFRKNGGETEDFIRARQTFLKKIENKFESNCQDNHHLNLSKLPTPYFAKQQKSPPQQLTSRIYKLLNQTRNLQSENLNLFNVHQSLSTLQQRTNHRTKPPLYTEPQIQQQSIQQSISQIHSKPIIHQHYHQHQEVRPTHTQYSLRRSKSIDELLPCRTNDSESAVSSQEDNYQHFRPFNAQPPPHAQLAFNPQLAFNAKSPFRFYQY